MRVYFKRPVEEARIVRPDNEGTDYELWVLTPTLVGSMSRPNKNTTLSDDGFKFATLQSAAAHILERTDKMELAAEAKHWQRGKGLEPVKVSGAELVGSGKWLDFCKLRGMNPRDVKAMGTEFELTDAEATVLGIERVQP